MAVAASVWVDVLPSLKNFGNTLTKQVSKPATAAGSTIASNMGQSATRRMPRAFVGVNRAFDRVYTRATTMATSTGSRMSRAIGGGATAAMRPLGRLRDGFGSAAVAASAFSGRAGTIGGVLRRGFDAGQLAAARLGTRFRTLNTEATGSIGGIGSSLRRIGGLMTGLALAAGLYEMGTAAVRTALDIEQSTAALTGLYGSSQKATSMMSRLRAVARESPIDHAAWVQGAESLAYMGYEGEQAIGVLRRIETALVASGKGSESMNQVTEAMLAMVNQGKASADEINRISQAGFPAWEMLATHMNMSVADIRKAVEKGEIGIDNLVAAMESGAGPTFAKMQAAAAQSANTMTNTWRRVKDNVVVSLGEMIQPLGARLTPMVSRAGEVITRAFGALPGFLREVGTYVSPLTDAFGNVWRAAQPFIRGFAEGFFGAVLAIGEAIRSVLGPALRWLTSLFDGMGPTGQLVVRILGMVIGAMVATAITARLLNRGFAAAKLGAGGLKTSLKGLWTSMKQNPAGWIITIIGLLVGAFIYLWNNSAGFRNFWIGLWEAIKTAATWAWQTVLKPTFDAIVFAVQKVGQFFTWLWVNAIQPAWNAIVIAAQWAWGFLGPILGFIGGALKILGQIVFGVLAAPFIIAWGLIQAAVSFAWNAILRPVFTAIGATARWLWNNVLSPVFAAIRWGWDLLVRGMSWAWNNVLRPVFTVVATVARWLWNNVLRIVFGAIRAYWNLILNAMKFAWNYVLKPVFTAIGTVARWVWNTILKPVLGFIGRAFEDIGRIAKWLYNNVIKPVWDAIGGTIRWVWQNVIKPAFDALSGAVKWIGDAFKGLGKLIKKAFDGIWKIIKPPIQLVMDVVWNKTLRRVVNAARWIGGDPPLDEIHLAGGGVIPGYAPGQDTVRARLSPGEAVLVPELVRAIGTENILAANRRYSARRRGAPASGFAGGGVLGAANGTGAVGSVAPTAETDLTATDAAMTALTRTAALLTAALDIARTAVTRLNTAARQLRALALAPLWSYLTTQILPTLTQFRLFTIRLGAQILALRNTIRVQWLAITNHVLRALNQMTVRQQQFTGFQQQQWNRITGIVNSSVNRQNTAFNRLRAGMASVRQAMTYTADWAVGAYGRIRAAAANPIRWVLNWPMNGLINAWNKLNREFALRKPVARVVPGFQSGGPVPGRGSRDTVHAMLTPGEYVLPKDVVAEWGLDNIRAAHLATLSGKGGREGLLTEEDVRASRKVPGFQSGGLVTDTGSQFNEALARGVRFARSMDHKPYVWGGSSAAGTDCSGYMGMIARALLDVKPYARREWATGSVSANNPPPRLTRGINGSFAVGVKPGHTAGTLAGTNVESGGSHGYVAYGGPAAGADDRQFPWKFHLPQIGGRFISGGGGGFDARPIVNRAFARTYRLIKDVRRLWPGNHMAAQGADVTYRAADTVKGYALRRLSEMYATSAGAAGSPAVVNAVRMVARKYGWDRGPQWDALSWLISHESSWDPTAANPNSSARGLFQKMTSLHGPVEPTPSGQAEWGLNYIRQRYTNPLAAKRHWQAHRSYDTGGLLRPGWTNVYNGTGRSELVLNSDQQESIADALRGKRDRTVQINVYPQQGQSERAIAESVGRQLRLAARR